MEATWNPITSQNHLRISTLTCSLMPKLKKAMSYLSLHGLKMMHQCPPLLLVTRLLIEFQCQGAICLPIIWLNCKRMLFLMDSLFSDWFYFGYVANVLEVIKVSVVKETNFTRVRHYSSIWVLWLSSVQMISLWCWVACLSMQKNREAHRRNCRCIAYMIPALNGRIAEITSAR
jgi:hypothetical protein